VCLVGAELGLLCERVLRKRPQAGDWHVEGKRESEAGIRMGAAETYWRKRNSESGDVGFMMDGCEGRESVCLFVDFCFG
jgi:hypothetical protein